MLPNRFRHIRHGVAAAAAATALAVTSAFCDDLPEITLAVHDGKTDVRDAGSYPLRPLTPYRIDFEARRAAGAGGVALAFFPSLSVISLPLTTEWRPCSNIVATASDADGESLVPLRFKLWNVDGEVQVRNWRVVEQRALHAHDGALELGEGESLFGNWYAYRDAPGGWRHNHSRPLFQWRGAFLNDDRYPMWSRGGEIVWRHELRGRRFLSGEVSFSSRYSSRGEVRASVSRDGAEWVDVGSVTPTGGLSHVALPESVFPCEALYVRLRCASGGVQVSSYSLGAGVTGEPRFFVGATRYIDADAPGDAEPPPFSVPEYYAHDYGELLPGTDQDLVLWRASSGWKIPKNRPIPSKKAGELAVSLAANETEAVQLVLTPSRALRNVSVTVDIPSLSAEVMRVGYLHIDDPVDSTAVCAEYPDPLPPLARSIDIPAGENCPFWIRVRAPKGTPAGLYGGLAVVSGERDGEDGGRFERRIPLSATVFGFELPDTMTCRTLFGFVPGVVDRYHGLAEKEDRLRVYGEYMRLMSEYHLSPYNSATYGKSDWSVRWDGDTPVFDWGEWDEGVEEGFSKYHFNTMALIKNLGIGHCDAGRKVIPQLGGVEEGDPRYETRLARYLGGLQDHFEEKGWLDRIYIYSFDEPPPKFVPYVANGLAKLKRYAPKLHRLVVSYCIEELVGGVQTWCMKANHIRQPLALERRREGDDFWLYVCTSPRAPYATLFIDHAGVELRAWLWQAWGEKATGILVWAVNIWNEKAVYPEPMRPQNPYVDPQSWTRAGKPYGNGDGRLLYPPESVFADVDSHSSVLNPGPNFDKPVGSIRGEMIRDGVEDYEYLAILRRLDPGNPLLTVPEDISKSLGDFSKSPAAIEAQRIRVAREIERLSRGGEAPATAQPCN